MMNPLEPTPVARIPLHPAQHAFLHGTALFRAFCGGIGSGKTWAGAYDLIRRAKAGRLYLVVAPTYAMLSDATFRSFLALAEELGLAAPGQVKRSTPPSIRLRTGAEVLFRSTDDPDRLRGQNLSGVWMDEASQMHVDAFNILIGRLREAGELGWLSATFTPKGRQHWTYETFGSGGPNTALYQARTADNPFLAAEFHGNVRQQYTTAQAEQDLDGQFIDAGDSMFRRPWFTLVDAAPAVQARVRYWDLAATEARPGTDPDWTVGVLMGRSEDCQYYIEDVRRERATPGGVELLVRQTAESDGNDVPIVIEREPGSAGVAWAERFVQVLAGYAVTFQRPTGSKTTRAAPLAAQAEHGNVLLVRGAWVKQFLNEFEVFPAGRHDDQVDATAGAFSCLVRRVPYKVDGPLMVWPDPNLVREGRFTADGHLIDPNNQLSERDQIIARILAEDDDEPPFGFGWDTTRPSW